MRNILRKLHIAQSDDPADGPSSPSSSKSGGGGGGGGSPHKPLSGISSWLNSVSSRHASPSPPPVAADGEGRSSRAREMGVEDEEEYQIQMALEISAKEDPEAAQIEAVKQISLGAWPPDNSPAELLAYRYWNYNVLDYDDKVLDGFYDLYGVLVESSFAKMPSLVDLQETPVSDDISWEAVLVNRAEDAELLKLEQRAQVMTLDLKLDPLGLVQNLAMLVAHHMGGTVCDPVGMLESWRNLNNYLKGSTGNMVLPLGCLKIGLARHRALLFKVLADNLDIPCRLVKGQKYTGSDDGALSIVKFKDGREYIVDLMADPGTLIPSDGAGQSRDYEGTLSVNSGVSSSACCYFENESLRPRLMFSNLDTSEIGGGTLNELTNQESGRSSSSMHKSSAEEIRPEKVKILDDFTIANNTGITKAQEPSGRPNHPYTITRSPSWTEGISSPAVRMMKVKDISQYMINATKENPDLAQKLHDVLLESGVVAPPNLFTEISTEPQEAAMADKTNDSEDKDELTKRKLELKHKTIADGNLGPFLSHPSVHDFQQKVVPSGSHLDPLKPVEGLGFHSPLGVREAALAPSSQSEASTLLQQDTPLQFIKHMPVAAAAATAAVVASSMVVAAAKSKNDVNLEVPVAAAATATAAAVVATTAAVSRQYEHLESRNRAPIVCGSSDNTNPAQESGDILDNQQVRNDLGQDCGPVLDRDASESHQEIERKSDKSTENESTKSDISLDDVAELEIPWEDIILGERIGLGSFGEVYRGEWHGTEIAVKKFLHQDISCDALEEFISEVRIMKRVRHPNVVLLMGAVTRVPNLSIVTEFLPRGSLFRLIHRPNNQLDERRRLRMALDVARGMNYLHNCTPVIVHRDLKSPNLLVDKNWVVKVCDFGLSRMKHNTFLSSRSTAGTAEWMAPEVLCNEPSDEKCDVYSFGVILWELCTLQQPWEGMNPMQVVGAVGFQHRRLDVPDDMDPAIADIINKCWQTDPKMRPSFSEIMSALKPLQKPVSNTQLQKRRTTATDPEKGAS